jgi:Mor family transcriptional regulator
MSNESKTRQRAAALLIDLADRLADRARRDLKVSKAKADEFGADVADDIAEAWGGQNFYIPMDMIGRVRTRDAQIYDEFIGDNQDELASKYGLSTQHIYRILRRERERRRVKQHALPF